MKQQKDKELVLNKYKPVSIHELRPDCNAQDETSITHEYMKKHGWMAATNPGRHILGSNLYWYFSNPSGGNTEYFADMDCMDDNWKPRIWDKNPGFSLWSIDTLTNN